VFRSGWSRSGRRRRRRLPRCGSCRRRSSSPACPPPSPANPYPSKALLKLWGAGNRVRIGLSYRFHGIDSWAPDKFKNCGSEQISVVKTVPHGPQLVVLAEPESIPVRVLDPEPNLDPPPSPANPYPSKALLNWNF
jgi:hypothetical protein